MGKHSATDGQDDRGHRIPDPGDFAGDAPAASGTPGTGRRRRGPAQDDDYFVPLRPQTPGVVPRHPEHREHSAWGAPGAWPGPHPARHDLPLDPVEEWAADWAPYDTASALSSPGVHDPVPRHGQTGRAASRPRQEFVDAFDDLPPPRAARRPPPEPQEQPPVPAEPAPTRGRTRLVTGAAAVAVLAALAVLAGTQLHRGRHQPDEGDTPGGPGASAGDTPTSPATPAAATSPAAASPASYTTMSAGSASSGPAAAPTSLTDAAYAEQIARRYPLDPALGLSGSFATVPGHQPAPGTAGTKGTPGASGASGTPGNGKVVRFRVDVEKGLPLDAALFSESVFRTLNDPRGWGHGGSMTFERVSTGPADLVVTLASPGTTAKWCAAPGPGRGGDDNVSCDPAGSTPRTMVNAYRWAQGAAGFGPAGMQAYRQMLVNLQVGRSLGRDPGRDPRRDQAGQARDPAGCADPAAPAPSVMRQANFLSLDGGPTCAPNIWPYP